MRDDKGLYRAIDVWKRVNDEKAICYRCFEVLSPHEELRGFCVQCADQHYRAMEVEKPEFFKKQFLELFAEEEPNKRSRVHKTLAEAIESFEQEFQDW